MKSSRRWMTARFAIYATGNSLNNIGNSMYIIALPLLVYHLTHSGLSMGLTVAFEGGSVFLEPFVGTLADRLSPRFLLVVSLLYQAALSAVLPFLYWQHHLTIGIIYVVGFLLGIGMDALHSVQTVVIPMMFGEVKDKASAGLTAAYTITTIIGPLAGAAALAASGYQALLWMNSLSFLAPIALLPWTQVPARAGAQKSTTHARPSWWDQTREGWRELMDHPFTKNLIISMISLVMANAAILPLAEFILRHTFGVSSAMVSGVFVVEGLGSFIGTQLPLRLQRLSTTTFLLSMVALNVLGLLFMLLPTWPAVPAGLLLVAMGYLGAAVARNLLLQNHVPVALLGRASSTFRAVTGTAAIASPLMMGLVTTAWGPETALIILATMATIPLVLMARRPNPIRVSSHKLE
jgi:predicted MFS family arabinose efflux permease